MEFEFDLYRLTEKFSHDYPADLYPELLTKPARPYTCLLIDTHDNYLICVPFRSSINHTIGYRFTGTQRSQASRSGLDYTKIIIITDTDYLDNTTKPVVDTDEYAETMRNLPSIVQSVSSYVEKYVKHISGKTIVHKREFERQYRFSTLKYFHRELGLSSSDT